MTNIPNPKPSNAEAFATVMAAVTSLLLAVATLLQTVTALIQLMKWHP
ncbi:hypothetical protein Rhe02_37680 [Rhizocola hellebori]|uniref:Uncharacterized protein n=1 Tax=Rhizocola hellebori TaxID=1392758 RepID=A0A8J3Q8A0_9ACTN|nr:hypothetical protein Rhe02_37680 [Rhizocola hellebori]